MRKRRAILYDDDPTVLMLLTHFFQELEYEVFANREPVICVIYDECASCDQERPCGDIMITDLVMPRMSGLELLQRQSERGCRLDVRNKAILSGSIDAAACEVIRKLGCAAFPKPYRLTALAAWVRECEQRMDLTKPLGARRKERRETCNSGAVVHDDGCSDLFLAEVVNRSGSGLCLRVSKPLAVDQVLGLRTGMALPSERLQVRWTRPDVSGGCVAGVSCC